jgi:hypothetical protein
MVRQGLFVSAARLASRESVARMGSPEVGGLQTGRLEDAREARFK